MATIKKVKGGKIRNCFEKWTNITQDQFVLNIAKFDLAIEYAKVPVLSKGVIVNTTREPNNYVTGIFTTTEKDGNYQNDPKPENVQLNFEIKALQTRINRSTLDLITEDCYFGSVDLKDTYYIIPIHKIYQTYLKLFQKEEYYQHIVIPNRFSPVVNVEYLRSKGHWPVKYIDDSLSLGDIFEICFKNIRATVALLREVGLTIHTEELVLVLTQQIILLRFVIDSVKMTINLTEERKQSI